MTKHFTHPAFSHPASEESNPTAQRRATVKEDTFIVRGKRPQAAANSAPGDDRLTFERWKRMDPACRLLLHLKRVREDPPVANLRNYSNSQRRSGRTPPNRGPIALWKTIMKLYTSQWASRLNYWAEKHRCFAAPKRTVPHNGD